MTTFRIGRAGAFVAFLALGLQACTEAPQPPASVPSEPAASSALEVPVGRLGNAVAPLHYRLELRVDPREDRFTGQVEIDVELAAPADHLWLHGKDLEVDAVWLTTADDTRTDATYEERHASGVALVSLGQVVAAGPATLHFEYSASFNTSTNAMFKVERGEEAYAVTQLQAIAARQVFPGFDEPAFKVPFDLVLVTRSGDVAVTTTPEQDTEGLGGGFTRRVYATTRPLPTYLLAFAVGPFDLVDHGEIPPNDVRPHGLPLRAVAARGQGEKLHYALEHTAGLLGELEAYFGTPYPYRKLDLIAVPESFGGAMENVGAIVYDEYLLLMNEDSPLNQRRTYAAVHAHELAHMWFGNLVTPEWWNDIWLNESFATWAMYKTADAYWPEGEFDRNTLKGALAAMANDSLAAARQIREPVEHNDKIQEAFDGITYQKGGGVLAMLERYVGEEGFRDGLRLHMERHRDATADAEDFIASIAEGSGQAEIEAAFRSFIEQPGVPVVSASVQCDAQGARLEVSQQRYAPLGSSIDPASGEWFIPMCVNYDADGGQRSTCAILRESQQTIALDSDGCPSRLHPNADGAGYYRFALDATWWSGLIEDAAELAPAEALVMADSLDAAFRAGRVPAETYAAGMAALIAHPVWDVADAATQHLEAIYTIVEPERLDPILAAYSAIARPRFVKLEGANDPGSQLLRQRMQRFLLVIARDQEMRAPLAVQAAAYLGLEGEPDPSAAPVDQLETILSIGVQDLGEPFFDLLLERAIASEDPTFRNDATGALARVEDPALVAKLHAALLEGHFKGTEFVGMVFRQMVRTATTRATFDWIRANDEAVIGMVPEPFRSSTVPALGSSMCSEDEAREWEAFVTAHADKLPGYERTLAQATESTRLCAALRAAKADELLSAFQALDS